MTKEEALPCSTHPDAPHGFLRNASHEADQYICECAYWKPPREQKPYDVTTDELIYMTGVDDGKKQERALWMLTKLGQEIEKQPDQDARRLQIAMRQWEDWKTYALELQKKLVKYEGGSPMILNAQPEEQQSCDKRPWVGLTKEEIDSGLVNYASWYNFATHLENILKEKNYG